MEDFDGLVKKVNKKLNNKNIYYICHDAERGIGLEDCIHNFYNCHIVDSYFTDYLQENRYLFYLLENQFPTKKKNSFRILESDNFLEKYSKYLENHFLMAFKNNTRIENLAKNYRLNLLNPSAKVSSLYENKISQYIILKSLPINLPKITVISLADSDYLKLKTIFKTKFVIQFNRGHSGSNTYVIESENDFNKVKELFPNRSAKITEFIDGETYTVNACVTNDVTFVAGLSYQITGIKDLTNNKGATVGNDFNYRNGVNQHLVANLINQINIIGQSLRENGYIGLFGIDFIVKNEDFYIIEINARQTASIPFLTLLQRRNNQIPLQLINIASQLGISLSIKPLEYSLANTLPINASQVMIRAKSNELILNKIKSGFYMLRGDSSGKDFYSGKTKSESFFIDEQQDKALIFIKEAVNLGYKNFSNNGFLVVTPKIQTLISNESEMVRLQQLNTAISKNGKVKPWIQEVLKSVYNLII